MDSEELVRRWRDRRREILKTLPPELLAEYRRLGVLIQNVLVEQRAISKCKKLSDQERAELMEGTVRVPDLINRKVKQALEEVREESRIPLHRHRETLIAFLAEFGPSTRREIAAGTSIPAGSLSRLLRGPQFEQAAHGLWRLPEKRR